MKSLKTVFLFATITSIKSESYTRYVHQHDYNNMLMQPQVTGNKFEENSDYYNCACFNKSQLPITEVLSNNDGGNLKRLVVYLYQNPDSDTLQMYTPYKEFQVQFPDLGIEDGELSRVGFETVDHVFEINQNSVEINKQQDYDFERPPNIEENKFIIHPYGSESLEIEDQEIYGTADVNEAGVIVGPKYGIDVGEMYSSEEFLNQNAAIYDKGATVETLVKDEHNANHNKQYGKASDFLNVEVPVVALPLIDLQLNSSSSLSNDGSSEMDSFQQNSEPIPTTSVETNVFSGPYEQKSEDEDLKNFSYQKSDPDFPLESESQLPLAAVNDWYALQEYNDKDYIANAYKHTEPTQVTNGKDKSDNYYVTFDTWFAKQMQNIHSAGKASNKNVDLSSLKQRIEKTLFENGLYVTKDGVLTDSNANVLDVDNLKLRPILIGDSITFNNVFSEENYELPSNLAYLESVLVTLINPSKILGVIPVRKTFVPRVSYRAGLNNGAWKEKNTGGCRTLKCVLQQKVKQERQKLNSKSQGNKHSVKLSPVKSIQYRNSDKMNVKQLNNDDHKNEFQYRFDLKKVLSTAQRMLNPAKDKLKKANVQKQIIKPKPKSDFEILVEEALADVVDDDGLEMPGFRIIGGFPATSSGTPISIKGRSGFQLNE